MGFFVNFRCFIRVWAKFGLNMYLISIWLPIWQNYVVNPKLIIIHLNCSQKVFALFPGIVTVLQSSNFGK